MMAFNKISVLSFLMILYLASDCEALKVKLPPGEKLKKRNVTKVSDSINTNQSNFQVSNGAAAPDGFYTYIAYLSLTKNTFNITTPASCGGVLISKTMVLTSAFCVFCTIEITAVIGGNPFPASEWIAHQDFIPQSETIRNDIGLVRLADPVKGIKPLSIKSPPISLPGQTATVCGWGETELEDEPTNLHCGSVIVTTKQFCTNYFDFVYAANMMCMESLPISSITNICYGDYGGPVLINNKLYGISSFSATCDVDFPAGFSVIEGYLPWITATMKQKSWTPPQSSTVCPDDYLDFNTIEVC
jgi:secreted trypsin-like serine protease